MNPSLLRWCLFLLSLGCVSLAGGETAPQDNWTLDHTLSGGSSNGLLQGPTGVAVAPDGSIVVADSGNGRIQVFSATGSFIRRFGTKGTGNGQFGGANGGASPRRVAVMSDGTIAALDTEDGTGTSRVELLQADGTFVRTFDATQSANGPVPETNLAITSDGKVAVVDSSNHRVEIFGVDGTLVRTIGTPGTGDGQFGAVVGPGIATTADGKIIVGDPVKQCVQIFANDGTFLAKFGIPGGGTSMTIAAIAAFPNGNIALFDPGNDGVLVFSGSGTLIAKFGSAGSGNGQLSSPSALAINAATRNQIVVADLGNQRIEIFAEDGTFASSFGRPGKAVDGFGANCYSMCVAADGTLFANDQDNKRTHVYSSAGQFIGFINDSYLAMAAGPNNTLLASTTAKHIDAISSSGALQFQIGGTTAGSGDGQLGDGTPRAVTDSSGNIYVADVGNNRVQIFDSSGNFVRKFGSADSAPGQLAGLAWIGLAPSGQVVVENLNNPNILQYFTKQGTFVSRQNLPYTKLVSALGPDGVWYLSDVANNSSAGTTILAPDLPSIATATLSGGAVALDAHSGALYTFDSANKRVNVWRRGFRTLGAVAPKLVPMPSVIATAQRSNANVIDIDYAVTDGDSSAVTVGVAAFKNGSSALRDMTVVTAGKSIEGTDAHLGANQPTGQVRRVSWDAAAAGVTTGNLVFEVFAHDERPGLLDIEFVTLPGSPALTISRIPITNADLRAVWAWLLVQGDPNLTRDGTGEILGPGGVAFTATMNDIDLNTGTPAPTTHTTDAGRAWIYAKLGVREATSAETTRARLATATGAPNQFTPSRAQQMGPRPYAVNEWSIDSSSNYNAEARWVVPLTP